MKRALILAVVVLAGCTQPQRVTCRPIPELPKSPTHASQLLLIGMYAECAKLAATP